MANNRVPTPIFRRLRGYSFDPSLSVQLDTALVNEAVFKIRWEEQLQTGPIGEYLEVIDFDPASNCFYDPVDLNNPFILAQDGLILDVQTLNLKYVVKKLIDNTDGRLTHQRAYRRGEAGASLRATYFGRPEQTGNREPFALLHSDF